MQYTNMHEFHGYCYFPQSRGAAETCVVTRRASDKMAFSCVGELSHNNRITRFCMMCRIVLGCAQHKHPEHPVVARECTRVTASKCLIVSRQRCLASDVLAIAKNNGLASKYLNIICGGVPALDADVFLFLFMNSGKITS